MRIKLTKKQYETTADGICPFCNNESLEENADDGEIKKGYTDYCYSCNASVKIKKTYAEMPTNEHYQFN